MRAELIAETGEAWDVHHFACLIGYGAGAVCPWLALETMGAQLHADLDSELALARRLGKPTDELERSRDDLPANDIAEITARGHGPTHAQRHADHEAGVRFPLLLVRVEHGRRQIVG